MLLLDCSFGLFWCHWRTYFNNYLCVGTQVEDAKALIDASQLRILACDDLDEAAKKVSIEYLQLSFVNIPIILILALSLLS